VSVCVCVCVNECVHKLVWHECVTDSTCAGASAWVGTYVCVFNSEQFILCIKESKKNGHQSEAHL
jgi:hypothetical protein